MNRISFNGIFIKHSNSAVANEFGNFDPIRIKLQPDYKLLYDRLFFRLQFFFINFYKQITNNYFYRATKQPCRKIFVLRFTSIAPYLHGHQYKNSIQVQRYLQQSFVANIN